MITIKKIEKVEKKKGLKKLTFDNGISCNLYYSELAAVRADGMNLEPETELTEEQFDWLMKEIVGKRAKKRAMFLLEQTDRSEQQLRDKLMQGGYPLFCIEEAISYVKKFHYLDDKRFACQFIRFSREKYSRKQLEIKLKQKGIGSRDIREALEEEYPADQSDRIESDQIRKLLLKRSFDPKSADDKERQRTYAFLMRRGFSSGRVLQIMGQ